MSNTELGGWLSNSKGVKILPAHSDSVMPVKTGIHLGLRLAGREPGFRPTPE
jgi:hypothetical protein